MKRVTLLLLCLSLVFLTTPFALPHLAGAVGARVNSQPEPATQQIEPQAKFNPVFQCDQPDRELRSEAGLVLQRPEDTRSYRQPEIILTRANGSKSVFRVQSASWLYFPNPLMESNKVKTLFKAFNTTLGANPAAIDFELQSNGSFQPLSGVINPLDPNRRITFKSCGRQTTSAYYWTRSSQNKFEAFACPSLDKPKGCPGVGKS